MAQLMPSPVNGGGKKRKELKIKGRKKENKRIIVISATTLHLQFTTHYTAVFWVGETNRHQHSRMANRKTGIWGGGGGGLHTELVRTENSRGQDWCGVKGSDLCVYTCVFEDPPFSAETWINNRMEGLQSRDGKKKINKK